VAGGVVAVDSGAAGAVVVATAGAEAGAGVWIGVLVAGNSAGAWASLTVGAPPPKLRSTPDSEGLDSEASCTGGDGDDGWLCGSDKTAFGNDRAVELCERVAAAEGGARTVSCPGTYVIV
jgi:hypothetical protein